MFPAPPRNGHDNKDGWLCSLGPAVAVSSQSWETGQQQGVPLPAQFTAFWGLLVGPWGSSQTIGRGQAMRAPRVTRTKSFSVL